MAQDNIPVRKGEQVLPPDRSDRVFQKDEFWYFHTREGVKIGPFSSKELAIRGADDYVGFAIDADPKLLDSLSK